MLGYLIFGFIITIVGLVLFSPWLKGWRTQIYGTLTVMWGAAIPLITQIIEYLQMLDWRMYVLSADRKNLTVLAIVGGLGIMAIIMRYMTTGPAGTKE